MAEMNMGMLPTIKCSNCGCSVEISSMGDHTCIRNEFAPVAPIPSPPPSAGFDSDRFTEAKVSRGPPSAIDPSAANRAFLQPNMPTPANSVNLSPFPASPAPSTLRPSHSPTEDQSESKLETVFSFPMPGNRSPTEVRTPSPMMDRNLLKSRPAPSPGMGLGVKPENIQLPPSPMPPKSPDVNHRREDSAVSHSSYRSSFASSRYGDSTTRSSANSLSRGFRSFMEDTPPVPLAPLRTPHNTSVPGDSNASVVSSRISKEEASGFDFGIPTGQNQTTGLHDLPEESPPFQDHTEYIPFRPGQTLLHPATAEAELGSDAPRKLSNASTTSAFSVTSFARALGLDDQMNHSEGSGSDSSLFDTRSGSSMSSLPSDASLNRHKPTEQLNLLPLVEDMPSRTRQTVLEIPGRTRSTMEDVPPIPAAFFSPDSPTDPSINRGGVSLIAESKEPPTPTLTPTQPKASIPRKPAPPQRSFTAPIPPQPKTPITPTRSATGRSKGKCKGCNETITGKSISSSDGRLTGRYHRGCFVCFECHSPFQTVDFYVLNNRPYCAQHYHERNGSLCAGCHTGIEGQYLETVERNPARPDRRRFHTQCLQCRTCHVLLKGDYFEWNGEVFCERDARRAAAASNPPPPPGPPGPPGRRRPMPGSSPLAQSGHFPPGSYPPPGARPGPGPGLYPGPRFPPAAGGGGGGRFPERRTTKLMMV
ncbi:Zinc finger LIM-type [Penicillium coprophilum]|uniref:Zinc finger LIM-type n=1 Tax=Penicillium coprophilum TaxID=36646 RepID=UPI0023A4B935|nr:Zinc finger LIM-type [Penicillium coprophilum]KAJ5170955.1 Zinc finger LIM-type [Penicillium coprophilum]